MLKQSKDISLKNDIKVQTATRYGNKKPQDVLVLTIIYTLVLTPLTKVNIISCFLLLAL